MHSDPLPLPPASPLLCLPAAGGAKEAARAKKKARAGTAAANRVRRESKQVR